MPAAGAAPALCPGCTRQAGDGMLQRCARGREGRGMFVSSHCVPGQIVVGFVRKRVGFGQRCRSRVSPLLAGAARAAEPEGCDPLVKGWDAQHEAGDTQQLSAGYHISMSPRASLLLLIASSDLLNCS